MYPTRPRAATMVVLAVVAMPAFGGGGLECANEPPIPLCTQTSTWVGLSSGFGTSASLEVSVDASNGNVRVSFAAGGAFPYGKQLTFWHNSRDNRTYPAGLGRNHFYNAMLLEHSEEWPPVAVRLVLANGYRIGFDENMDGTFRGEPGVFSRLSKLPDGSYRLYTNGLPDMADDGQVLYEYGPADPTGRSRLLSVTDSGAVITLTYVASGSGAGEVERVREDSTGREVVFAYDGSGRISSVTSLDRVVTSFTYSSTGDVSRVDSSWGALTFGCNSDHNISVITDGAGGHSAYASYVASARGSEFRDTSGQTHDFVYTTTGADTVASCAFGLHGADPTVYGITANRLLASVAAPGQSTIYYEYNADKCLTGQHN